ncbi:MAG: CBS domain-containing protein [Chloroflexi bacterium]|nr:CBS domain-containing protein [Chloroflexota bacterium]
MYKRILIGLDGSAPGRQALEVALDLAKANEASVTAISVEERLPAYADTIGEIEGARRAMESYFYRLHNAAEIRARQVGIPLQTVILAGNAAQTIAQYADREGFDLIVLGAAGHGPLTGHIGATTDRVVEVASCSVLVVRYGGAGFHVRDVMSRQVKSVAPEAPLAEVVALLWREGVKAVPVVDHERHVQGIITGGDLIERGGLDFRLSLQRALSPDEIAAQARRLEQSGKTAADIMTLHPLTVPEDATLADAAQIMVNNHIKRLPVVNADGALAGILSRLDVLRHIAALGGLEPGEVRLPARQGRLVREVMVADVPAVDEETRLEEVTAALVTSPYRRVVVTDAERHVVGLISDRELLSRVDLSTRPRILDMLLGRIGLSATEETDPHLRAGRAGDVMISPVVTVHENAPLVEAIRRMVQGGIKRLPVVDAGGRLVGMVDRETLFRAMVELAHANPTDATPPA